jgi:uncharacterized cofD-like protein
MRESDTQMNPNVVALGGGHGLSTVLSGLRDRPVDITAVVTVADDGGSSGRIRRELPHLVPPGDLRMAIAALAHPQWEGLLQHRLPGIGELGGHPVGNLVLAGLLDAQDDVLATLRVVCSLVGVKATVLPLALEPLTVEADLADGGRCFGQVSVAAAPSRVVTMRISPARPQVPQQVLDAIALADLVVLGPGSLWTSLVVHLLVPEVLEALQSAKTVHVLNLHAEPGEASGLGPVEHLDVLHAHGLRPSIVVADRRSLRDRQDDDLRRLRESCAGLVVEDLARPDDRHLHDPSRLADVLLGLLQADAIGRDRADSPAVTPLEAAWLP